MGVFDHAANCPTCGRPIPLRDLTRSARWDVSFLHKGRELDCPTCETPLAVELRPMSRRAWTTFALVGGLFLLWAILLTALRPVFGEAHDLVFNICLVLYAAVMAPYVYRRMVDVRAVDGRQTAR